MGHKKNKGGIFLGGRAKKKEGEKGVFVFDERVERVQFVDIYKTNKIGPEFSAKNLIFYFKFRTKI